MNKNEILICLFANSLATIRQFFNSTEIKMKMAISPATMEAMIIHFLLVFFFSASTSARKSLSTFSLCCCPAFTSARFAV